MPGKHWNTEAKLEAALHLLKATEEKLLKAEQRLAGTYVGDRPDTNDPPCADHPGEHFSTCRECAANKTPMPPDFRTRAGLPPKGIRAEHKPRKHLEPTTTPETANEGPTA